MQIVNSNEPVVSLEVSTDGGSSWLSTTRTCYNYFEDKSGFGTDTVDVRITGASGSRVTVQNVSCQSESTTTASSNFSEVCCTVLSIMDLYTIFLSCLSMMP